MDQHTPLRSRNSVLSFNHDRASSVRLHGFRQKRALRRGGLKNLEVSYLKYAAEGNVKMIEKMFSKYSETQLDRNCTDCFERTALVLAIMNRHEEAVEFLLREEVNLTESLFYAIETEFTDAVEAILQCEVSQRFGHNDMLITSQESIFPRFLSPIMLAAHTNNYEILELLYSHGHRLRDFSLNASNKWDQIRLRWLYCKAKASQAYMILMYNKEKVDPLNEAIDFYGQLKDEGLKAREVRKNYLELAKGCEDFSIALLDQIRTAQELADILRFSLVDRDIGKTNELVLRSLPILLTPGTPNDELSVRNLNGSTSELSDVSENWVPNPIMTPQINIIEPQGIIFPGNSLPRSSNVISSRSNSMFEDNTAELIRNITNTSGSVSDMARSQASSPKSPRKFPAKDTPSKAASRGQSLETIPKGRHRTLGIRRRVKADVDLEFARPIHFLKPIETAVDNGMIRLVTCENAQIALAYLKDGLMFRHLTNPKLFLLKLLVGFMFPVISIAFLFCPNTNIGSIARNPTAKLWMEVFSDVYLIFLLVLNLIFTQLKLVDQFSYIIVAAYFWMVGKFFNLVFLTYHQRSRVLYSIWNWNDLATIICYTVFMYLRTYTKFYMSNQKTQWSPIPISDMLICVVYILVFLRPLEILRVNRMFGPLQVSIDRMLKDVSKFFLIFLVFWFAFSCGINTLFWRYNATNNNISSTACKDISLTDGLFSSDAGCCFETEKFTSLFSSLQVHFWSIFGYSDEYIQWFNLRCDSQFDRTVTAKFGEVIFALYHVATVIVLVNMLIAIMSGTLQRTIDESDIQWQFHRTRVWIRFIRTGFYRPPPMNLIPRPKDIAFFCKMVWNACRKLCRCKNRDAQNYLVKMRFSDLQANREEVEEVSRNSENYQKTYGRNVSSDNNHSQHHDVSSTEETLSRYDITLRKCVKRYLKTHILQSSQFQS